MDNIEKYLKSINEKLLIIISDMNQNDNGPLCFGCGNDIYEDDYFMLHNNIWKEITGTSCVGMLCWDCAEQRMNRKFVIGDFIICPLNGDNSKIQKLKVAVKNK